MQSRSHPPRQEADYDRRDHPRQERPHFHRLSIQLIAHGLKPHPIAVDNYFVERVDTPKDENGQYNF